VVNERPLWVTQKVIDEVAEHARASYAKDEEACGYLTGPADAPLFCDAATPLVMLAADDEYCRRG